MDALLKIIVGVIDKISAFFAGVSAILDVITEALAKIGHPIFMLGFLGILYTFLWFLFRYLDRKKLVLPTVMFAIFFMLLLGGGSLLLFHPVKEATDADELLTGAQNVSLYTQADSRWENGGVYNI